MGFSSRSFGWGEPFRDFIFSGFGRGAGRFVSRLDAFSSRTRILRVARRRFRKLWVLFKIVRIVSRLGNCTRVRSTIGRIGAPYQCSIHFPHRCMSTASRTAGATLLCSIARIALFPVSIFEFILADPIFLKNVMSYALAHPFLGSVFVCGGYQFVTLVLIILLSLTVALPRCINSHTILCISRVRYCSV